MENIFSGLEVLNGEVSSKILGDSFHLNISGEIEVTKGNLTCTYNFWCNTFEYNYAENLIGFDDFDWDFGNAKLGNLPIDNLIILKDKLSESGLTTLANSLEISCGEIRKQICLHLASNKTLIKVYGKKFRVYENLSEEEQTILKLDYVISTYDKRGLYEKTQFNITEDDENGNKIVPTLEQLIEFRKTFSK
jgi:hypothetical protein